MLRPFGGLFIINIGQYIKLYKGDLPRDDGMFQSSDTADFHAFIKKNNIDIKGIDVENLDELAISRYLYLSFLKSNYKQIDFKWLMCAYMGREKSINAIDDSGDKACLQNLLLLNRLDKDGEQWWQELSSFSRKVSNLKKEETGREGEKLVYEYEKTRLGTGADIKKMYIEDNSAGYDLLSYVDSSLGQRLHIEVKSTKSLSARAYITANELNKAKKYSEFYNFYFVNLNNYSLAKFSYVEMKPHLATEQGDGKTEIFSVPFSAFEKLFFSI